MKPFSALLASLVLALAPTLLAEETVTLEGVHLCCKACAKGVDSAVASVKGASSVTDQDLESVTITAPSKKVLNQSIAAILEAGYYGTPSNSSVKVKDISGAKNQNVKSLTVNGVHLCCGKCVTAVEDALSTVKGVTGNTAEKKAQSFQVLGDFNEKEVFAAFHKAGITGKASR